METCIRRAEPRDAPVLTALMHASSAYRGEYARILSGYALTPDQIERDLVFLAEGPNGALGFYSLALGDEPELDLMFVADGAQGTGLGRRLFEHMRAEARGRGLASIRIVSHPPALGFYRRMGAEPIGTKPPSGGRVTWERPVLRLPIGPVRGG